MYNFTVIVGTYNRGSFLRNAINSLLNQNYTPDDYEIMIVDNGSIDDTKQVVEERQEIHRTRISYLYEPRLGFSQARNTGIENARNEYIAFMDDDAVADPNWLKNIANGFTEDEDIVCIGGRIELLWDSARPKWLSRELEGYLGCNNFLGDVRIEFPPDLYPFGGNMAVKREPIKLAGGFDLDFGRMGNHLQAHGETRVCDLLRSYGRIMYVPEALVYHRVLPYRATRNYFLQRGYLQGIANANLTQLRRPRSRTGLLRSAIKDLFSSAKDIFEISRKWIRGEQSKAFARFVFMITRWGQLRQTLYLAFKKQS